MAISPPFFLFWPAFVDEEREKTKFKLLTSFLAKALSPSAFSLECASVP